MKTCVRRYEFLKDHFDVVLRQVKRNRPVHLIFKDLGLRNNFIHSSFKKHYHDLYEEYVKARESVKVKNRKTKTNYRRNGNSNNFLFR